MFSSWRIIARSSQASTSAQAMSRNMTLGLVMKNQMDHNVKTIFLRWKVSEKACMSIAISIYRYMNAKLSKSIMLTGPHISIQLSSLLSTFTYIEARFALVDVFEESFCSGKVICRKKHRMWLPGYFMFWSSIAISKNVLGLKRSTAIFFWNLHPI